MTFTAIVNVVDGIIRVEHSGEDIDISHHDGQVRWTLEHVEPWGFEEFGMERADATLDAMGWRRVSEWDGEEISVTCQVEPR